MAAINIDFPWSRGRIYKISEPTLPPSDDAFAAKIDEPHIQQTGPSEPLERPLLHNPHLYLDFAQVDGSPESCRRFAQKWGLLRTHAEVGAREPLSYWRDQIRTMKESVDGLRHAIEEQALPPLGAFITDEIELFVTLDKLDGRPALSFHPRSLVKAMRIQLAQSIASGKSIEVCQACSRWFETGGRGPGAKRAKTKFCSDKCRNDFHYDQRRVKK
jgi:hypothetical protein